MKKLTIIALLLSVSFSYAQEKIKPKFEKQGDKIEATFYHENGAIEQHGYFNTNKKLEGTWTSYDINGNKTAIGEYKNGVKNGKWFFWSENKLKEVDYSNNAIASVNTWENKKRIADRK